MFVCTPDSGQLEKQLEDVSLARRDLEDSFRHVKTLEKQMKAITQERDELHKVICAQVWPMFKCLFGYVSNPLFLQDVLEATEKLRSQSKELKEAHSQRKLAMQEFSELNERLTDLRLEPRSPAVARARTLAGANASILLPGRPSSA